MPQENNKTVRVGHGCGVCSKPYGFQSYMRLLLNQNQAQEVRTWWIEKVNNMNTLAQTQDGICVNHWVAK